MRTKGYPVPCTLLVAASLGLDSSAGDNNFQASERHGCGA